MEGLPLWRVEQSSVGSVRIATVLCNRERQGHFHKENVQAAMPYLDTVALVAAASYCAA